MWHWKFLPSQKEKSNSFFFLFWATKHIVLLETETAQCEHFEIKYFYNINPNCSILNCYLITLDHIYQNLFRIVLTYDHSSRNLLFILITYDHIKRKRTMLPDFVSSTWPTCPHRPPRPEDRWQFLKKSEFKIFKDFAQFNFS